MALKTKRSRLRSSIFILGAVLILGGAIFAGQRFLPRAVVAADAPNGVTKSVIVKFKNVQPVTNIDAVDRQQAAIETVDTEIANAIPYSTGYKIKSRSYDNLPYAVYTVDAEGEASLKADPNVETVFDNTLYESLYDGPISTVGGNVNGIFTDGTQIGYTGDGYAIAVLDSGVDKNHPALAGKVIAEACFGENETYSNATIESLCPGAATFSDAAGSGQDCTITNCGHGTGVASAAALGAKSADIDQDGQPDLIAGSAQDAKIIAIKIAAKVTSASICPTAPGNVCSSYPAGLYLAAMDYVATLSTSVPIAAANLSVGGGPFTTTAAECAADPSIQAFNAAAASLRAHNIAPVVASGNSGASAGMQNKIASPACAQGAISVSATNVTGTQIASYANNGPLVSLLAPGGDYDGTNNDSLLWYPENGASGLKGVQGTSFAAPIVAGAYAVLREKHPSATVDQLTALLQSSGTNVTDTRSGYTVGAKKLIDISKALTQSPYPTINSFTGPSTAINEGVGIALVANVSNAVSCSINNGIGNVAINAGVINMTVPGADSYELYCENAYGDSVVSTLEFTINEGPTTPEISDQVFDESAGTFAFSWSESNDPDGVEEYRVYVNGQQVAVLPSTQTSYTVTDLLENTVYVLEVRAVDSLGALSVAGSVTFGDTDDAVLPGVPNTGIFQILYNPAGRLVLVAGLGVLAVVTIVIVAKRRSARM